MEESTKLGYMIGSALHEDWRRVNAYRGTRYKKAGKDMNGNVITSVDPSVPSRVNEEGVFEIDILNTSFDNLTPAWKQENLDAGMFIAKMVSQIPDFNIDELELESAERSEEAQAKVDKLASAIHDAWMARDNNAWAKVSPEEEIRMQREEPEKWDEYQFKPYADLNQMNKELDIDQLRVFARMVRAYGSVERVIAACPEIAGDALVQTEVSATKYSDVPVIDLNARVL